MAGEKVLVIWHLKSLLVKQSASYAWPSDRQSKIVTYYCIFILSWKGKNSAPVNSNEAGEKGMDVCFSINNYQPIPKLFCVGMGGRTGKSPIGAHSKWERNFAGILTKSRTVSCCVLVINPIYIINSIPIDPPPQHIIMKIWKTWIRRNNFKMGRLQQWTVNSNISNSRKEYARAFEKEMLSLIFKCF